MPLFHREGITRWRIVNVSAVGRWRRKRALVILEQLALVTESGVPLASALAEMTEDARNTRVANIVAGIRSRLAEGGSLAEALEWSAPTTFSKTVLGLVAVGEKTGTLPQMLRVACRMVRMQHHFMGRLGVLLFYPVFVALVIWLLTAMIMVFTIPRFQAMFAEYGAELPAMTRYLVWTSSVLANYWYGVPAIALLGLLVFVNGSHLWPRLGRLKYTLPLVGPAMLDFATALLAGCLGMALKAGVRLPRALALTREAHPDRTIGKLLTALERNVAEGGTLTDGLARARFVPETARWLISTGEASGNLPDALTQLSDFYDSKLAARAAAIEAVLGPLFVVIMGGLVAMITVGLFTPLVDMTKSLM